MITLPGCTLIDCVLFHYYQLLSLLSVLQGLGFVEVVDFYSGSVGVNGLSGFPINSSVQEVDVMNALRQSITSDGMLGTSNFSVNSSTVKAQECKSNKHALNDTTSCSSWPQSILKTSASN